MSKEVRIYGKLCKLPYYMTDGRFFIKFDTDLNTCTVFNGDKFKSIDYLNKFNEIHYLTSDEITEEEFNKNYKEVLDFLVEKFGI